MSFQLHNGMGSAFFTTSSWGPGSNSSGVGTGNSAKSRPGTSSGERESPAQTQQQQQQKTSNSSKDGGRERKSSFGRKPSFTSPKVIKRSRSSSASGDHIRSHHIRTDSSTPPAIPDFALAAAAKASRETEAVAVSPTTTATAPSDPFAKAAATPKRTGRNTHAPAATMNGHYSAATSPPTVQTGPGNPGESSSFSVHQHIHELANKRIATLDYLRKAYVTQLLINSCNRAMRPGSHSPTFFSLLLPVASMRSLYLCISRVPQSHFPKSL